MRRRLVRWGAVADRRGSKRVVLISFGCAASALALMATNPPAPIVYALVLGAGSIGSLNVLMAYVGIYYPQAARATGICLVFTAGRLIGAAGPAVARGHSTPEPARSRHTGRTGPAQADRARSMPPE